jgi:putative membrane protein
MEILSKILIGLIASLHFYIMYLEMFAWSTKGKKVFKGSLPDSLFEPTKVLAANQGLYNGFLAVGLVWSLYISDMEWSKNNSLFFLFCIAVAGVYGSLTASKKIFFVQTVPAILAILFILFAN